MSGSGPNKLKPQGKDREDGPSKEQRSKADCTLRNDTLQCNPGFQCYPCRQQQFPELGSFNCGDYDMGTCIPCLNGDYCVNETGGCVNRYMSSTLFICPPGKLCRNSTVTEDCPPGYFCPPGTFYLAKELACPDDRGLYCPLGSREPSRGCPAGYYCPNSYTKIICPERHYCKEFSMEPMECKYGEYLCLEGSTSPALGVPGLVGTILAILATVVFLVAVEWWLQKEEAKQDASMREQVVVQATCKRVLARLFSANEADMREELTGFEVCERPIDISFHKLKLMLKGEVLLESVSGSFVSGALVAVMGPSGSGKSTLLNTLCSKATYGVRTGAIRINGEECDLRRLRKVMGFVPQDDTVFTTLTVKENLYFSAQLRLDTAVVGDPARVKKILGGSLRVLGLEHIKNKVVGSVEARGISGGQKKRVNIGVELVADPTVLFLDEPTSGLGSTDTLIVMKACESFTQLQRTAIAVIHQPRYSVFTLFSDVMLLGRGGRVVYSGPTAAALEYFKGLGFVLPPNENPADFFLDCISGRVPNSHVQNVQPSFLFDRWESYWKQTGEALLKQQEEGRRKARKAMQAQARRQTQVRARARRASGVKGFLETLPPGVKEGFEQKWKEADLDHNGTIDSAELDSLLRSLGLVMSPMEVGAMMAQFDQNNNGVIEFEEFCAFAADSYADLASAWDADPDRKVSGMAPAPGAEAPAADPPAADPEAGSHPEADEDVGHRQTRGVLGQLVVFSRRAWIQWLRAKRSTVVDVLLLMVSALVVGLMLGVEWGYASIPHNSTMSTMTLGVLSTVASLKTFGDDRVLFWRERASGVSTFAYFLSKATVNLIADNVWRPALFLSVYYNLIQPNCYFLDYLTVLWCVCWACNGMGIFIGAVFPPSSALLAGVLFPLITGVFLAGVSEPVLGDMDSATKTIAAISFARWASEAITTIELENEKDYQHGRVEQVYDKLGYDPDHYYSCLLALGVLGLVFRVGAYVALRRRPQLAGPKLNDCACVAPHAVHDPALPHRPNAVAPAPSQPKTVAAQGE